MMKKILGLFILAVGLTAVAEEPAKVRVTGGRVNIRSRASLSGELMGQVMLNDELVLAGETNGDFVAVIAPDWVECWVATEYIQDGIVVPPKLKVRAGPNMNYGVVAVVARGDKLDVIKDLSGWLKIKAPTNTIAWITAEFIAPVGGEPTEAVALKTEEVVKAVATNVVAATIPEPSAPEVTKPEPSVAIPDMASAYNEMVAEAGQELAVKAVEPKLGPPVPIVLELNPATKQGDRVTFSGLLQPSRSITLYRLVGLDGRTKCFVRGKSEQMREWVGKPLKIEGTQYFYKRLELPVVWPQKLYVPSE
jgi:hypothetical protein